MRTSSQLRSTPQHPAAPRRVLSKMNTNEAFASTYRSAIQPGTTCSTLSRMASSIRFPIAFCSLLLLTAAAALAQSRPPITGIAFMRVYTTDPAAAEKFYGPTMGFPETKLGDTLLFSVNHSQWIEVLTQPAPPTPTNRLAADAFTTTDAEALQRYLAAKGIQPAEPLKGGQFAVRDPEGNLVFFVQRNASTPTAAAAHASRALPSATSDRMIHVGFIVHDRAKEDAFWRDILGFRPYWYGTGHPGRTDYVSLQVPEGTDWLEYMLNPPATPELRSGGSSNHFSLGVDRMQTVLAGLQKNECQGKMCTAIQAGVDGKIQLNLFDPDQTRVEYMEFQPVMKPCCSEFTGKHPSEGDTAK